MLPDLPTFDPNKSGARIGNTLNRIFDRIKRQTLIGSRTVKVTDTDKGTRLDRIGGVATAAALPLGFAVTHTGSDVIVSAGKVITQNWSGTAAGDFRPDNWTLETNFTGATLSASATEVWIKVTFSESDTTSEGVLGTTDYDLSGGAGGDGGGGGGGGAQKGDSSTYPTPGSIGDPGGIFGGDGGQVLLTADDSEVLGEGDGAGGDGGLGGTGGAGSNGTSTTFTRATKGKVKVRYYTLSNITAHTAQGAHSETTGWVQIATISGVDVVQHHIGTLRFTPAAPTFVPL